MAIRLPRLAKGLLASFSVTLAQLATAEPINYGFDLSIGTSDNISRTPTGAQSETIAAAGLNIAVLHDGNRLDADIKGDFRYLEYLQNTYDGELTGRLDGLVRLSFVPEHFEWVVQENYGQSQVDPFAPVTPANREDVNYFSTGPDFSLRLGSAGFAKLSGRYSQTNYEISDFDGERLFGGLAVGRQLSSASDVSLNASTESFKFDNTAVNTDYDRRSAYVRYQLHVARTELGANLGYSETDQGPDSSGNPLVQLELTRKLSPFATLRFEGGTQLTDAGDSFRNLEGGAIGGINTGPVVATSESYQRRYLFLEWRYVRERTTIAVSANWMKDEYDSSPLHDVDRTNSQVSVERRFTRTLTGKILGGLLRDDYDNAGFEDKEWNGGAELNLRVGAVTTLTLRYDHFNRSASEPGSEYNENRIFLTLGYRPR